MLVWTLAVRFVRHRYSIETVQQIKLFFFCVQPPSTYTTPCFTEIKAYPKTRVLPSAILSQTLDLENLATAHQLSVRAIWTMTAVRRFLYSTWRRRQTWHVWSTDDANRRLRTTFDIELCEQHDSRCGAHCVGLVGINWYWSIIIKHSQCWPATVSQSQS